MLTDLNGRYLFQVSSTQKVRNDIPDTTFDLAAMDKKAKEFTQNDYVLTFIYDILKNPDFQNDPSYYVDCWEQRRVNANNLNKTQDKALEFFKMHFPVKLSFDLQKMEAEVMIYTEDESTRNYLKLVLNCPEFKRNPQGYIAEMKEKSKETDVALKFLEKHFPEESTCIIC